MKFLPIFLVLLLSACAALNAPGDRKEAAAANTDLGMEYMNQGQNERAMEKLKRALEQDPASGPAHAAMALLYTRLDENKLAEKHYRKAAYLEPKNSTFNNNYGAYLCANNKVDEAIKYFNRVLADRTYPSPENIYTNVGMCLRQKPDPVAAEENFRKALERNPRYGKALAQMALLSYEQEDYLKARAFLQRYESIARPGRDMLALGMRIEKNLGNDVAAAEYAYKLRSSYPGGREPYAEALENRL